MEWMSSVQLNFRSQKREMFPIDMWYGVRGGVR
jgi:hypothetical protein